MQRFRFFRIPAPRPRDRAIFYTGVSCILLNLLGLVFSKGHLTTLWWMSFTLGISLICSGLAELLPCSQITIAGILRIINVIAIGLSTVLALIVLAQALILAVHH